jgi:hypothetical protein
MRYRYFPWASHARVSYHMQLHLYSASAHLGECFNNLFAWYSWWLKQRAKKSYAVCRTGIFTSAGRKILSNRLAVFLVVWMQDRAHFPSRHPVALHQYLGCTVISDDVVIGR